MHGCRLGFQLTSLLLRWTDALEAGDGGSSPDGSCDREGNDSGDLGCGDAAAKDKAVFVAAGLKAVKTVCTKAENNKGESERCCCSSQSWYWC